MLSPKLPASSLLTFRIHWFVSNASFSPLFALIIFLHQLGFLFEFVCALDLCNISVSLVTTVDTHTHTHDQMDFLYCTFLKDLITFCFVLHNHFSIFLADSLFCRYHLCNSLIYRCFEVDSLFMSVPYQTERS